MARGHLKVTRACGELKIPKQGTTWRSDTTSSSQMGSVESMKSRVVFGKDSLGTNCIQPYKRVMSGVSSAEM